MVYWAVNMSRQDQTDVKVFLSLDFKSHRYNQHKVLPSNDSKDAKRRHLGKVNDDIFLPHKNTSSMWLIEFRTN
jgi:hypothetical protein